ncbi:putative F-box domain, FBD domain, leucine-rich repeat domain superfamily [Helianthus debilis subsp. tardiflorus]
MSSIGENVDDLLDRLPEEIVSHILSLMPTKYAVRTSVLSKKWRYVWMSVTNLDFAYPGGHLFNEFTFTKLVDWDDNNFTRFVDRVLKFCKTSQVKLFRLHISRYQVPKLRLSNWIDKAIGLNVREVDICASTRLPSSLFTCKTLTKLRLNQSVGKSLSSIYLPCLKSLDIVGFPNSKLIHGCPMLESLSSKVSWCDLKKDYIFNIPTLKRLELMFASTINEVNHKVVLRVPNLEFLSVVGVLSSSIVVEDVSSLVGASIACHEPTVIQRWVELLKGIRRVQNLSIQYCPIMPTLPIFPNMKHLELKGYWPSKLILRFLECCPELKTLCLDGIAGWFCKEMVPACMLTNLTTIKFSKCEGYKGDMEFLEYVLGNAKA